MFLEILKRIIGKLGNLSKGESLFPGSILTEPGKRGRMRMQFPNFEIPKFQNY